MIRFFILAILFVFALEIYSLTPASFDSTRLPRANRNYLVGGIHTHSNLSDGGGPPDEIAEAGRAAGLDFVVLTDHNNEMARTKGYEHSYGPTDLFVETEVSTSSGHMLSFFSHTGYKPVSENELTHFSWKSYRKDEPLPGMFTVISHRSNRKNPWRMAEFSDGFEVVNFDSVWQQQASESLSRFLVTLFVAPLNRYLATLRFTQVHEPDLNYWDEGNQFHHGHFGILAHDSHALMKLNSTMHFKWPPYEMGFRLGSNVVFSSEKWSEDFETRKKQLYRSIRDGRSAILFQFIHPFEGNDGSLQCGDQTYRSGDVASPDQACEFVVRIPESFPYPARVRLIKNGVAVYDRKSAEREVRIPVTTSTFANYRIEVWTGGHTLFNQLLARDVPYLLYNPIYVK